MADLVCLKVVFERITWRFVKVWLQQAMRATFMVGERKEKSKEAGMYATGVK